MIFLSCYESSISYIFFCPRITIKDGRVEILGFIKNKVIPPSEIQKISMEMITVDDGGYGPGADLVSFKFDLRNGKSFILKDDLNTDNILGSIRNFIKNKKIPTLAVYQIKDILKKSKEIELDKSTKSYLETGNSDLFLESRRA